MMTQDVLIGGEESGGISIKGHIPEGDGILFGLLLIEIVAASGATLAEAGETNWEADVGPAHYARRDYQAGAPGQQERNDGAPGE